MSLSKASVLIFFPAFLGGGAESVCAWMLQALKNQYRVQLLTFSRLKWPMLNQLYGTSILPGDVELVVPLFRKWMPESVAYGHSSFALRQHLLICYLKALGETHDIVISAFNEIDAGRRAIQYIHFPMIAPGHEVARKIAGYPDSAVRRLYRRLCQGMSRFSSNRMKGNLTLTNSCWTAGIIRQIYGLDARVIYPPTVPCGPVLPWAEREEGFVLVSRLVPDKKIERAIRILLKVRSHGYDVHLHIVGTGDKRYRRYLANLVPDEGWIMWEGQVNRTKLNHLLAVHKYGIHAMENEHFGIAVAEMVNAGCIPFIPDSGGQVEIVGRHKCLTFYSEDEAADKITRLLPSKKSQEELRHEWLEQRKILFSSEHFEAEIRDVVSSYEGL